MIRLSSIIFVLAAVVAVVLVALAWGRLEGDAPVIAFDREFAYLDRSPSLELSVEDPRTGLRDVRVTLHQGDVEVVLVDESYPGPGLLSPSGRGEEVRKTWDVGALISDKHTIREGPATLEVSASDYALRGWGGGNRSEEVREFAFDIAPPRLEVLSDQHYIRQGGSDLIVYRVGEDAVTSGVRVGSHFFRGYPAGLSDPTVHFALLAFAYDQPVDTPVQVVALDEAGNESVQVPWHRVSPSEFRSREITVDDDFMRKVVPEILSYTPEVQDQGDLLSTWIEINGNLRTRNHEMLRQLSESSQAEFLWDGAFLQLSNSQVESLFADRRTYMYQGRQVDQQDHVGFDLSVVAHYPIEAANSGRVMLAEYFGIYGNTVLIDHGAGLVSLYGHMSSIDVAEGDMVTKGQILGRSGETGLAGGDHLHFGMFLQGVPVNPIEWWDPKWIQDHILDRLGRAGAE
jgi:murein DD-endopeptidase MepM/ murein hydrolase activator NlpD